MSVPGPARDGGLLHRSDVILNADRGTQFTRAEYQSFPKDHHIVSSMSDVGHCGDNAAAEGFFGKLKRERVHRCCYLTEPPRLSRRPVGLS
ncbi:hypothetical protein JCM19379_21050 [Methyloparacoccus murrellii]